ncbi:chemotaxis protein CheB [Chlorogloeopsis sp. ULAP01]|uniref:chemotaxis protein CheB n=1 Tax=Chlorogloeopsis sp. ULAP01 TaxID=3056483 RepID=UPI0025AACDC3|nr:chemotaxis protein CheB [Chlorogloeopsis sp. ULAP01]MDM9379370.1 chemotaxis protein CheB [Chlorogloeopsis sp. ULAP01]
MTYKYIVVLASSAGGLKALSRVLSSLPSDFPAPIVLVQHLSPQYPSMLADIFSRCCSLVVKEAHTGDILQSGTVYIAPPDQHLLINLDGTLSLAHTQKVRYVRPAADVLFKSAATSFHEGVIAVVLTGKDSDGAAGVQAVKEMGGIVIAQDRASSEFFSMPDAAISTGVVDYILPLDAIAATLLNLVNK